MAFYNSTVVLKKHPGGRPDHRCDFLLVTADQGQRAFRLNSGSSFASLEIVCGEATGLFEASVLEARPHLHA